MPAQVPPTSATRGERSPGRRTFMLAVGLPLVVVLLVFAGMMGQFDQATWNVYSEIYRDLPNRLSDRFRDDIYLQYHSRNLETEEARARLLLATEDLLLEGHQLDAFEIYFKSGGKLYLWDNPNRGELRPALGQALGGFASLNGEDQAAMDLVGALKTARMDSIFPRRIFWLGELELMIPIFEPTKSTRARDGGEPSQALLVLHFKPRDMRIFMSQLAGLGLLLILLLGAIMALMMRNALYRASAVALGEQRRKDLALLHQITQTLARPTSGDSDYLKVLAEMLAGLNADVAGLYRRAHGAHPDGAIAGLELQSLSGHNDDAARPAAGRTQSDPLGPALLEFLAAQNKPVHIDDLGVAGPFRDSPLRAQGFRSLSWIPMRSREELIGGLFAAGRSPGGQTEQQRYILEVIGTELMLIFIGDRTRAESLLRQQRFETLGRVAVAISSNAALEDIMQMVLREALRGTEAAKGFIAIQGEDDTLYRVFGAEGLDEETRRTLADPRLNNVARRVLSDGRPIVNRRFEEFLPPELIRREALRSMLAVPIVSHREQAVGALVAFSPREDAFGDSEREIVEALANQAAIAYDQNTILEAHKEQTRLYEAILEKAHDLIFFLDEQGRFTYVNQALPNLLGYGERDMLGQELVKFCNTGDLAWLRKDLEEVLAGSRVKAANVRLRDSESRWRFVEANLSPIYGRSEGARGVFGIARDATEARLTDMRQKRLLGAREVIADLKIGVPLPDILASATGLIGKLFGVDWVAILIGESEVQDGQGWQVPDDIYDRGSVLGPPMRGYLYRRAVAEQFFMSGDIMAEFFAQAAPAEAAACRRRPVPLSIESVMIVSATGEQHGVLLLFHESPDFFHGWDEMPLRNLGSELGNLISQKFLESQILIQNRELAERTRRATEATQLKSRFLAAISHELRTPLHAIIGFTEVVMEKTPDLPPRRMRNLDAVLRNARMLLTLIEDLLDLSRIEAGKVKVRTEQFNVGELLEEVAQSMRSLAEIKGLELRVQSLEELRQAVTDRSKVRQIIVNLVSNAIKFTDDGGVSLRAECDDARMRISVQDTGIGIAADDLGVIFQEFEQINASETEGKRGSGLGLALSQRLAGVLGGSIYVETMAGEGSTFTLDLPLRFEFADRAVEDTPIGPMFEVDASETLPDFPPPHLAPREEN